MKLPRPQPGLVISYSYLWAREHQRGAEEGRKTRPCAIVAARRLVEGHEVVTVVPVTHSPPSDPVDAVEIPAVLKVHLGLDDLPSWVMLIAGAFAPEIEQDRAIRIISTALCFDS